MTAWVTLSSAREWTSVIMGLILQEVTPHCPRPIIGSLACPPSNCSDQPCPTVRGKVQFHKLQSAEIERVLNRVDCCAVCVCVTVHFCCNRPQWSVWCGATRFRTVHTYKRIQTLANGLRIRTCPQGCVVPVRSIGLIQTNTLRTTHGHGEVR